MKTIFAVSGWIGKSRLSEYQNNRDNVDLYIIETLARLRRDYNILTDVSDLKYCKPDVELHFNVQLPRTAAPKVCLLLEDSLIRPQNLLLNFVKYKNVITWDRGMSERMNNCFWLNYPYKFLNYNLTEWQKRSLDFVMIASNRNVLFDSSRSLYNLRYEVIDFFLNNSKYSFELYGSGWEYPFVRAGFISRLRLEFSKRSDLLKLKSPLQLWKGMANSKYPILNKSKFNFCYENVIGINGYVSEKIYDSLVAGTIPIYIPSSNFNSDLIPKNIYIDPRDFDNMDSLVRYCRNIDNAGYQKWLEDANRFIDSRSSSLSPEKYSKIICQMLNCL